MLRLFFTVRLFDCIRQSWTRSKLDFGHVEIFGNQHEAEGRLVSGVNCGLGLKTRHKRTSPLLGRFSRLGMKSRMC
jgi:hypothetical protein